MNFVSTPYQLPQLLRAMSQPLRPPPRVRYQDTVIRLDTQRDSKDDTTLGGAAAYALLCAAAIAPHSRYRKIEQPQAFLPRRQDAWEGYRYRSPERHVQPMLCTQPQLFHQPGIEHWALAA